MAALKKNIKRPQEQGCLSTLEAVAEAGVFWVGGSWRYPESMGISLHNI